jgi:hypothetical protein
MEADCWRVETFCENHPAWRIDRPEQAAKPGFSFRHYFHHPKGTAMKLTPIALAAALALCATFAYAQSGAPSGAGSTAGDPAASSANPRSSPTTGSSMTPSRSGSGTSTSGGSDANED